MGIKRSFEEGDFPETSFRQPKQRDYPRKLTLNAEEYHIATLEVQSPGEAKSMFYQLHFEQLEDSDTDNASVPDKELETSAPLSLVTSSSSEEDVAIDGSAPLSLVTSSSSEEDVAIDGTSDWSCFPGYTDNSIPRRPLNQFDDPYISLFNSPPKKLVPLGSDHQAEVPPWDPNASYLCGYDREERLIGTCLIAIPDLNESTMEGVGVGCGRTDCSCLDMGSMRCVQQHVDEAREKLRETIGYKNFMELGFCNMGDEVAYQWTSHGEQVFHDIVYSSPAAHGRSFWKYLSAAFPTRTKKELVSYYFNVFMLRRRAVQNRSYLLEIDSDDDEEELGGVRGDPHQNRSYPSSDQETDIEDHQLLKGEFYLVEGGDEDSMVESFGNQDLDVSWVDDFWSEPQNGCGEDEPSNVKHGVSEGKVKKLDVVEMNGGEDDETMLEDPGLYT